MFALFTFLMDLILFGADKGAFVDVWVDFNVGVVAQFESILRWSVSLAMRGLAG
jgi:hypothetical protein